MGDAVLKTLISSDSHIIEPPDLWTTRLPKEYRDRGPQVRRVAATRRSDETEADYWFVDGHNSGVSFGFTNEAGMRYERDPKSVPLEGKIDKMGGREGILTPERFLEDSERDHVVASLLNPSIGLHLFSSTSEIPFLNAMMRAYNDFMADFCSYDSERLKAVAVVNIDDPQEAAAEMTRAREQGLSGVMIPVAPTADRPYSLPDYEPIWATAEDLGLPISLHLGTNRDGLSGGGFGKAISPGPTALAVMDIYVRVSLGDLIFSGVFERHPKLRVGTVEHELGWIPHFLERCDYTYTQRPAKEHWPPPFKSGAIPSDFWSQNCFASFQEDPTMISGQWKQIGVDNLLWGSDYPHFEATFPHSKETLEKILVDVPIEDQRKIVHDNAKRLFGFAL